MSQINFRLHSRPAACEGGSEASAEEHIGQPLSPAKIHIPGADAVAKAEGYTNGRASASAWRTRRGRRTWHVWKLVAREPGVSHVRPEARKRSGLHREGEEP